MEQKKGLSFLRFSLGLYALIALVYGVGYLFLPEKLVELAGGEPVPAGWLRWSGSVLIAFGIGAIMVIKNPVKQRIFVFTIALGSFFVGLTLIYQWVFETIGDVWFTAFPAILLIVVAVLLFTSCRGAKEILK